MRRVAAITLLTGAVIAAPVTGTASAADEWRGPRLVVGVLAGVQQPDLDLADFSWDVTAQTTYGAQALVGFGRFGAGVRLWRARTTQETGLPDVADPTVRLTTWEIVTEGRVLRVLGTELLGTASVGRLHLGYEPDRLTVALPGASQPLEVAFEPIDEWTVAIGATVRRRLLGSWAVGLQMDHRWFGLDTAHRSGDAVAFERHRFGNWGARLALSWLWSRP